jgi:hypothetical protein
MNLIRAIFVSAALVALAVGQMMAQTPPSPYLRQASITETKEGVAITADSPRPLLQALDALRQKYGWVVDYEDPQYTSRLDIADVPDDSSVSHLPSGGNFKVEFPGRPPEQEATLRLVVDAYNQSTNPGRFELRRTISGGFYVVGISAHDMAGTISQQVPLLDTPVTVPVRQRSIADTINVLCHVLAAQSHTRVTVGISPRSILAHTNVKIGASRIPARELLLQTLSGAQRNLYWCLFFDPNSNRYVLDIHSIKS